MDLLGELCERREIIVGIKVRGSDVRVDDLVGNSRV